MFSLDRNLYYRCSHCGNEDVKLYSDISIEETATITSINSAGFSCNYCSNFLAFGYSLSAQENSGYFTIAYMLRPMFMELLDKVKIIYNPLYISQIDGLSPLEYVRTLGYIEDLRRDISGLSQIDRRNFEQVIAELIRQKGFQVELTKRTRDGGRDIIGITNMGGIPFKLFVECKRKDEGNPVDIDIVRSVYGVHNTKDGPNKSIIVSATHYTKGARNFSVKEANSMWDLDLYDYNHIAQWIRDYPQRF